MPVKLATITIEGYQEYSSKLFDAFRTKRLPFSDSAAIVFGGAVLPVESVVGDHVELKWPGGAKLELANVPDPTVKLIRVFRDRLEIRLALGAFVEVRLKS